MRGSPLTLTFVLALGLLLAGVPVWFLTRPHDHATPVADTVARTVAVTRPLELQITSSTPAAVELRQAGQLVWSSSAPAESFTATLPAGRDAAEFVATVRWLDASKSNAARFQFSYDGESLTDATLWGEQQTEDIVRVPAAP